MERQEAIRRKFDVVRPFLNERLRRVWAASEAHALGRGGVLVVAVATGVARSTIGRGLRELRDAAGRAAGSAAGSGSSLPSRPADPLAPPPGSGRQRRLGGGRTALTQRDPALLGALDALVEPTARGDPQSPLRWTTKSVRVLARELTTQGHPVSPATVATLLHQLDYSLQAPRKTKEGADHPDRDAQFVHINGQTRAFQARGQPVVSIDAKKKELVGNYKNGGREWRPAGQPEAVRTHDFPDKTLGKVAPYGIYDLTANTGWVSVGTDHDTASFAVDTLHRWWQQMGHTTYPAATELLLQADSGGSNSSRSRLWKVEVQRFADATGLRVHVCHFPPGTSKWNKIEHRLFAHITENWRGRPLVSHEVIVNLIGHTTTRQGLRVQAELNTKVYPTGTKVSDATLATVRLQPATFHGDWNYTITPRSHS